MYKVINTFKEKQHGGRIYEPEKPYPAEGEKLDEKRAEFLMQVHPIYKVAFLVKEEATPDPPKNKVKKKKSEA